MACLHLQISLSPPTGFTGRKKNVSFTFLSTRLVARITADILVEVVFIAVVRFPSYVGIEDGIIFFDLTVKNRRLYMYKLGELAKTSLSACRAPPGQRHMALPSTALEASTHTYTPLWNKSIMVSKKLAHARYSW